jgi:hypothetical protein
MPQEAEDISDQRSILQSDVLPQPNNTRSEGEKAKAAKVFRYRVEKDDSYTTKKRNTGPGTSAKPGRPRGSRRFEEVTLDSDEDPNSEFGYDGIDEEHTGPSRGRASNWLARKNQGEDEDIPTELPANFRDGDVRPNREQDRERRRAYNERKRTMSGKPGASIRPIGRPLKKRSRNSTGDMSADTSNEDALGDGHDQPNEELLLAQQAAAIALEAQQKAEEEKRKNSEAAAREAQENLRTKMSLFEMSDDNASLDGFLNDLTVEEEPSSDEQPEGVTAITPRTGPPESKNSLLSRPGMSDKKIKITSASSKRNGGAATVSTAPSSFTSINRTVDLSASDSDDEVPATAPPKNSVGRPRGRPSMVPTRGASTPKRGRGRPRKNA